MGRGSRGIFHATVSYRALFTALLATTAIAGGMATATQAVAQAQAGFNIPAGPLNRALAAFGRQSGTQLSYDASIASGKTSPGAQGTTTREQALARILQGSGLVYTFSDARNVLITRPATSSGSGAANVPGAIQLDTVDVSGGRVAAADAPYSTPAQVAHISQETIDRFRGSSPADIFRGTPGVMSGEARNGAGGIDVNIRGMQGMGRVATTIDGAENGVTVAQSYQGISNRTFVDPDLIASIDIKKGADSGSRGIAGTVAMRTLSADDVVKPGEKWGVWIKSGFGTNTGHGRPGALGGYKWDQPTNSAPHLLPNATSEGMNRPGFLDPTSGSGSVVAAIKEQNYDILWGYAHRKQGNYYAGKNGPGAEPVGTGPRAFCSGGNCQPLNWSGSFTNYFENGGISSFRAGEQVLNTQLDTQSLIAKATFRSDDGHSLQVGYNGFRSEAGDLLAFMFSSPQDQAIQQRQSAGTQVDTGTLRYRYKPDNNDLVDLKSNLWMTKLKLRNQIRSTQTTRWPEDYGLPRDYRTGSDTQMWGGDVTNRSLFSLNQFGSLDFTYGVSLLHEGTNPTPYSELLNNTIGRNGQRQETGTFAKAAYKPFEWLTLNGGLRYSHYRSEDFSSGRTAAQTNSEPIRSAGGYSPSWGVVVEPVKGVQAYVNHSNALRMPSLVESLSNFAASPNPNLRPERANNWEAGINIIKDGVFAVNDKAMFKFGYFNWNIKDYAARQGVLTETVPGFSTWSLEMRNIDRARFEGMEFSSRYENNGFTAELAANYYLDVQFCVTANTCENKTIPSDFGTNQIPPKYSANLTVSQKLFDDALTVGGRATYNGARAAGHGTPIQGLAQVVALVDWKPYWLFDVFAEYKLTNSITAWSSIENLTDQYYVDPLSLVVLPGPGRTFRLGLTGKFGGDDPISPVSLAKMFAPGDRVANWTGFHGGVNAAYNFAKFNGTASNLDGSAGLYSAAEAPGLDVRAFSFGLSAGYDYQFANRLVVGVAADIAKSQISGSQVTYALEGESGNIAGNLNRVRQFEAVQKTSIDWLATVRGRLGYAFNDRLMVYATGGAAFLRQDDERTQYLAVPNGVLAPTTTAAAFTESASLTRTGYAFGGGAEYAIGSGWSLTGEFLMSVFGQKEYKFRNARAGVLPDYTTQEPTGQIYDPSQNPNDPLYPLCQIIPAACAPRPIYETVNHTGSANITTGRKILSKIQIPMIKIGLNYKF